MKTLLAFGLFVAMAAAPAAAQFGGSGALGGRFASRGMSRPLGGITPGFTGISPKQNFTGRGFNRGFGRGRRGPAGFPYAFSVWVPDYFDYLDYANQYAAPYGVPPASYAQPPAEAAPQQPVIINQYFDSRGPAPAPQQQPTAPESPAPPSADNSNANANTGATTSAPGGLLGTPQNYYLIAYKNHEVYPALAYWVEDNTLHYVTTENTHNQASLDLIDIARSKELNKDRDVPFTIPGR